jgi:signal recognition particle subunit SEC65
MKVVERMQLIEDIACTLRDKFTFNDIDVFLAEFNVSEAEKGISKKVYVKDRLRKSSIKELAKIAEELDIRLPKVIKMPPKNWENSCSIKAFISHASKDKTIAKKLRDALKNYNIEAFVAHEDIKPTEEWLIELKNALNTTDFFISIHTKGFKNSIWCQQEIGYAIARQIKLIPIKFDEDPEGFIGRYQALIRGNKSALEVAKEIFDIIRTDPLTKDICREKVAMQEKKSVEKVEA